MLHHRVDLLTVEFNDSHGGAHSAVFLLPAHEASDALLKFAIGPTSHRATMDAGCQNSPIDPKSVLVSEPSWEHAEVPAEYRALVYAHLIERLRRVKEVGHVYRYGEVNMQASCPEYTVRIAIATFREGSSVQRAFLGPVGMFVGTTQMKFDVTFTDASGAINSKEQITATMRGKNESTDVADHVAKTVAKHYAAVLKNKEKSGPSKVVKSPGSAAKLNPKDTPAAQPN